MIRLAQSAKPTDNTLHLTSTYELGNTGSLELGDSEVVSYTGKSGNDVTGVTRAVSGQASTHMAGTEVRKVTAG